jgi:hypothetical protein
MEGVFKGVGRLSAGTRFGDFCTWLWCGPCALCQVGHLLACTLLNVPPILLPSYRPQQIPCACKGVDHRCVVRTSLLVLGSSALEGY